MEGEEEEEEKKKKKIDRHCFLSAVLRYVIYISHPAES